MSFTEQVKNELARIPREDAGSRAAELLALLRMSGSFITGAHASWGLEFSTGNSAVARRVLVYLKKDFGFMPSTMVRQGRRLRKKNVYTLLVQPSKEGLHFLDTMGLSPLSGAEDMEKLVTAEERRAYLAGAFLGGGSVSRPQSDYHLEMVTQSARFAEEIVKAMKSFRLNARLTDRKNDYIVYIKDGDEVSEFLQIVGAAQSYMDFESVRVVKDMRNRVNRQVNCETANLQKPLTPPSARPTSCKSFLPKRVVPRSPPRFAKPATSALPTPMPASPSLRRSAVSQNPVSPIASKRSKRWWGRQTRDW